MVATAEAEQGAMRHESGLRLLAGGAGLGALKVRMGPAVDAIGAPASADSDLAREMGVSLSDYLTRMRTLGERPRVRLEEEVSLAESYLEVGRLWFGSRLRLEAEIDSDCLDCLIPPLVLQPLLNSPKPTDAGVVRLEARRVGHRLRIVVEQPLDSEGPAESGEPEPGSRIVRERLAAAHGADAIFAARRLSRRRLAVISIPARTARQGSVEELKVG
jgi:LytS/YehU family sensor histidine kinase